MSKIDWLALAGFLAGALVFVLLRDFVLHA